MENKKLTIIYTNDLHAMIDGFGKMAAYIDEEKSKANNFLYLDAGDISSGHPVVDLHHGRPIVELLNQMDLHAMAIGNHDFDYGQGYFEINRKLSDFPWLGANIAVKDHEIPIQQPEPYHIFRLHDLTVGVVSVIETPPSTMAKSIEGLEFLDPLETLKKYLRLRNEVDVLIALTHVGVGIDRLIAEQLEGYDLIIGGHSHSIVELEVVNGTPIVNGGAYGQVIGHLEVHYNPASHKVDKINNRFISIESLKVVKAEIQSQVEDYFHKSAAFLNEAMGQTNGLSIENLDKTDAPMGNFWTDALRYITKADIALTNNGGIRTPIYPEKITRHQIYRTAPFRNQVVVFEMSGEAIAEVIRHSYTKGHRIDLQTSGLKYTIITDDEGRLVDLELSLHGEKLDPKGLYQVATNDYIAYGGDGYHFRGKMIEEAAGEMANAMIRFAEYCHTQYGHIDYQSEGRIQIKVLPSSI